MEFQYFSIEEFKTDSKEYFKKVRLFLNTKKYEIIQNSLEESFDIGTLKPIENLINFLKSLIQEDSVYTFNIRIERYDICNKIIDLYIYSILSYLEICFTIKKTYTLTIYELKRSIEVSNISDPFNLLRYATINMQIGFYSTTLKKLLANLMNKWDSILVSIDELFLYIYRGLISFPESRNHITDDFINFIEFIIRLNLIFPETNFKKIIPHLLNSKINPYIYCRICLYSIDYKIIINNTDLISNIYEVFKLYKTNKDSSYIELILLTFNYLKTLFKYNNVKYIDIKYIKNIINILLELLGKFSKLTKQIINNFCDLLLIIFEEFSELCDTYLIREIPNVLLNIIDNSNEELCSICSKIFTIMNKNIYFQIYIGTIIDDNGIEKLRLILKKETVDSIINKMNIFKRLCDKDSNSEFIDNITSTFIVIPAIIKNGDQQLYCDKYAMLSYLSKNPENPYNREILTPETFENYNKELKSEIDEYEKKRREFVVLNRH